MEWDDASGQYTVTVSHGQWKWTWEGSADNRYDALNLAVMAIEDEVRDSDDVFAYRAHPDCEECGFGLPKHDKTCSHHPDAEALHE